MRLQSLDVDEINVQLEKAAVEDRKYQNTQGREIVVLPATDGAPKVFVCGDCGSSWIRWSDQNHYPSCKPGSSFMWSLYYAEEGTD